jgi:hypothetical protein
MTMTSNVRSFARNPVRYAKRSENRIPSAILLFIGLVAIAALRRGAMPDQRGMIAIGAAAIALVLVASVAPDLVTWVLLVAIVVSVIQNRDTLAALVDAGNARFRTALSDVGVRF